jgi:hypothetical protein
MRLNHKLQLCANSTERWKENRACTCQTSFWSRITLNKTLALNLIILLVTERNSNVHSIFIMIANQFIECLKWFGIDTIDCLKPISGVDAIDFLKHIRGDESR